MLNDRIPLNVLQLFREFRPYFDQWVTKMIEEYVDRHDALVGFILLACAIDWLAGFYYGKELRSREVKGSYTKFIDDFFPKGRYIGNDIYDGLRNGLVHQFSLKGNKYALTHNHSERHLTIDSQGRTVLNARDFFEDWVSAKNAYFDAVEKDSDLQAKWWKRYDETLFLGLSK